MSGRKPDFHLAALDKSTEAKNNRIGAAWKDDNGSITIVLDNFIQLTGSPNLVIKLFPNDRKPSTALPVTGDSYTTRDLEKDIPF